MPASTDYSTDGVVFKLDSTELHAALGDNNVDPRWALAWKFLGDVATTTVLVGAGRALTCTACSCMCWAWRLHWLLRGHWRDNLSAGA